MTLGRTGKPLTGAALDRKRGIRKGGRRKGTPNRIRAEVAEMVRMALELAHPQGAVAYLVQRAKKSPNAFLALVGKLMPTVVKGDLTLTNDLALRLAEAEARAKKET